LRTDKFRPSLNQAVCSAARQLEQAEW